MELDVLVRELYALRPQEFTAARDAAAAKARQAGELAQAKDIGALRKPTLAAWCANLLARADEVQTRRLLDLGRALRDAHRTLAGEELRELSHQQHVVIAAMARQARTLADEAGQPVSEGVQHEVEQILHTVLTAPEAASAWVKGVLAKAPTQAVGFDGLEPTAGATPRRPQGSAPAPASEGKPGASGTRAADGGEARKRARAMAEATAKSERAAREVERAEADLATVNDELADRRARLAALDEEIDALQEQVARAGQEHERLSRTVEETAHRHTQAVKQAKKAKEAHTAAAKAAEALATHQGRMRSGR